jgi:hypothetical protein
MSFAVGWSNPWLKCTLTHALSDMHSMKKLYEQAVNAQLGFASR